MLDRSSGQSAPGRCLRFGSFSAVTAPPSHDLAGLLAPDGEAPEGSTPALDLPIGPTMVQAAELHGNAAVRARLGRLASEEREALALVVLAEASLTEAAVVLQADRRTVGRRLRSALRACRSGALIASGLRRS